MGVLCIFLLAACYYDCRYRRIPNLLSAAIFVAGALGTVFHPDRNMLCFLAVTLLLLLFLYPFFKLGVLGAGDVKLLGACAGFFAYEKLLTFLFFVLVAAAILSLLKLLTERSAGERFFYLWRYLVEVARRGKWQLYFENERERYKAGIPLAGPVLCSALLHLGGVY